MTKHVFESSSILWIINRCSRPRPNVQEWIVWRGQGKQISWQRMRSVGMTFDPLFKFPLANSRAGASAGNDEGGEFTQDFKLVVSALWGDYCFR